MPSKVKGLEYQAEQPAFLQRLRAGAPETGDRHERPIPRPKRNKVEDDEDAPAYVMEDTNESLSKDDYEKLVKGGEAEEDVVAAITPSGAHDDEALAENPVMSGALPETKSDGKKEKHRPKVQQASLGQKKRKAATAIAQDDNDVAEAEDKPRSRKPTKKAKPIKLSFDDD